MGFAALNPSYELSSPRKRGPIVPYTRAAGILGPRLRGDDSLVRCSTTTHEGASPRLNERNRRDAALPLFTMSNSPVPDVPATTPSNHSSPFPRRRSAPGFILHLAATPEGMAERRQARIPRSRAALVRRGAHLAIGALASRRSAVTVLGRESPASRFRHWRRNRREGLAAGALIEPWRRPPTSRSAVCRDATPAPPSGSSPETPLVERDVRVIR